MATRADVARLQQANRGIVRLAKRDLDRFWHTLDLTKPALARDALLEFTQALTSTYGEVSATVSADWYDELRTKARPTSNYRAQMAELVDADIVAARTRFAASHLFTDQPFGTLDFLGTALSEYILQPGRETVVRNTNRDPNKPLWARVPQGAETCAFCLMLASRGPVYLTAESAGDMNKFHGDCDCAVVPIWPSQSLPEGYDPDGLYQQFLNAADTAGGSTKATLAEMRRQLSVN